MEVVSATDVVVNDRRPVRGLVGLSAIEIVLQDRVDRTVGARPDLEGSCASRLQPVATLGLGEPEDADAGAKALLGMAAFAQNEVDECGCGGSDLAGLPPEPLWRPVGITAMRTRHVGADRRVAPIG